jgi:hypothetical protein
VALGLGLAACQKGLSVGFTTAAALVHELLEARDEKRLLRLQKQLAGYQLGGNCGVVISAEVREASRQARHIAAQARAADLAPVIGRALQAAGVTSLGGLARGLSERGIPTARGGMK